MVEAFFEIIIILFDTIRDSSIKNIQADINKPVTNRTNFITLILAIFRE